MADYVWAPAISRGGARYCSVLMLPALKERRDSYEQQRRPADDAFPPGADGWEPTKDETMSQRFHRLPLLHRLQEFGSPLANLAPIRGSFHGGVAEVEPNEHARHGVLIRRLREARIGPKHRLCVIAGASGG